MMGIKALGAPETGPIGPPIVARLQQHALPNVGRRTLDKECIHTPYDRVFNGKLTLSMKKRERDAFVKEPRSQSTIVHGIVVITMFCASMSLSKNWI